MPFIWLQGKALQIGRKKSPQLISHLSPITFLFSNYKNPSIQEETAGFHSTGWNDPWRQDLWILTSAPLCHLLWSPDPVLTCLDRAPPAPRPCFHMSPQKTRHCVQCKIQHLDHRLIWHLLLFSRKLLACFFSFTKSFPSLIHLDVLLAPYS